MDTDATVRAVSQWRFPETALLILFEDPLSLGLSFSFSNLKGSEAFLPGASSWLAG